MARTNVAPKSSARSEVKIGRPRVPALYGLDAGDEFLPWSYIEERLVASKNYWICTARPDGRPHSIPVWGFWLDGTVIFGTARESRKAKNLARNPAVSIHLESGDEAVIIEGEAEEVNLTDKQMRKTLDAASKEKYKMPLMVTPETVMYRVSPRVVLGWREKDFPKSATRWEFPAG